MVKVISLSCFLFLLSAVSSASSLRDKEIDVIKKIGICLKKKDPECLKGLVAQKIFSPEGPGFKCKMAEKGSSHIKAEDFVECVFKSKGKDDYCSQGTTLFEAMSECFTHAKALHTAYGYIKGSGGYICYLKEEDGKVFLESVVCGP